MENKQEINFNIEYLITYFSNIKTIKLFKSRLNEISLFNFAGVENIMDIKIKIDKLVTFCKEFYKNVLIYLPLCDIYFLYLRFYKGFNNVECCRKLDIFYTYSDVAVLFKRYNKFVYKWLNKAV